MCRHSPSYEIGSCAVWLMRILKTVIKANRKIFETRANFSWRKWKAQWEAVAEEYCWATAQAVGLTYCRTIWFQYDGIWIWSGFPCIHIRNCPCVYSIPTCTKFALAMDLLERNYCLRRKVSVCRLCTDYCVLFDTVLAAQLIIGMKNRRVHAIL